MNVGPRGLTLASGRSGWGGMMGLGLLLFAAGCGQSKPPEEVVLTPKGVKDLRLVTPPEPPKEEGKAVLDELGISPLQIPKRSFEKKRPQTPPDEKADAKKKEKEEVYRRPKQWIKPNQLPYEYWEVQYYGNEPRGYLHQKVGPSAIGSAAIYRLEAESFVRIAKDRDQHLKVTTIEETDGQLKTIEASIQQPGNETKVEGNVVLGSLRLKKLENNQPSGKDVPWKSEYGGPFAVAQSLHGNPMMPGELRKLSMFNPFLGEVVHIELRAKDYIKTPLLDGLQHKLLEIASVASIGDKSLASTLWVNEQGETQKTYTPSLDTRSFRAERSLAESIRDRARCEAFIEPAVKLIKPIDNYETAEQLVFQFRCKDKDPFEMLPSRTNQSIKSLSAFMVKATVHAMREKTPIAEGVTPELKIPDSYLDSTPMLQTNDAAIKQLAADFIKKKKEGMSKMEALRIGVYEWIKFKQPFSPHIKSAAEVARDRTGDSAEHAVLLAALVRSLGVPTRIATGLVYNAVKDNPAMVPHVWTEVYFKDHWVSVDASVEASRTNATYLKFVDSPFLDHNPYAALLPVLQAIDLIEISVIE